MTANDYIDCVIGLFLIGCYIHLMAKQVDRWYKEGEENKIFIALILTLLVSFPVGAVLIIWYLIKYDH